MRKIKAIWRLIWSDRYLVYTSNCFGQGKTVFKIEEIDFIIIREIADNEIEAEESLEYVKSLLTEI